MEKKLNNSELYTDMLKARISILLRINDKEKEPKNFERNKKFLNLIENIYSNFEAMEFDEVYKSINSLTAASRDLLKHEWNRARDGEKKFQEAKAGAEWAMGAAGAFLMAILMTIGYESLTTVLAGPEKSVKTSIESGPKKQATDSFLPPATINAC
jgi:hypothetical protein